jgi:hypothetical protein
MALVSGDLFDLFQDLYDGKLDLTRFNYVVLTLLPKKVKMLIFCNCMPIFLVKCDFKVFTIVINYRIVSVVDKVITLVRTAFIKGSFI